MGCIKLQQPDQDLHIFRHSLDGNKLKSAMSIFITCCNVGAWKTHLGNPGTVCAASHCDLKGLHSAFFHSLLAVVDHKRNLFDDFPHAVINAVPFKLHGSLTIAPVQLLYAGYNIGFSLLVPIQLMIPNQTADIGLFNSSFKNKGMKNTLPFLL